MLEASGTGNAAYKTSIDGAKMVVATFRGRVRLRCDYLSKAKAELRDMVQALRNSSGRDVAARTARDAAVTKARESLMSNDEIATKCLQALMPAQARLDTTTAVDVYKQVKDGLAEMTLDMSPKLAYVLSCAAIAKAREHVDALEALLEDFGRLSSADRCALGGFIDEATQVLELLGERRNFLCRGGGLVEVVEEALSSLDDESNALSAPRGKAAAFGRFKAAASTAGAALAIATALRYFAARERRAEYDSVNEEEARLRHELEGFEAAERRGSAWDEELDKRRAAWKAAFDKTDAGRAAAIWKARVRAAAGTLRLLTGDICSVARGFTDKGHVVCAKMKEEDKVIYLGVTWAGNVEAEAKKVIKRGGFLIKNDRGGPIKFKQCEVVSLGEVDSKVTALLIERTLQAEISGSGEYKPTDYAFSGRGFGTLTHTVGKSEVFVMGITMQEGDQQRPSPCPRNGVVAFTAEFEAKIAAATAPPSSMPDERARGDLDVHMIKASPKRPVYHAYTRGPWSVHRWTKSRRAPFADEQRWLWPSADDARKWTQDKIDEKTSERGGYSIEDEDK